MSKVPVSVIIPIYNEEANLSRALESVSWADEVFVVDSHSTDSSGQIADRHGAKVVQFELKGNWPKKKNWALDNLPFRNEWTFIMDADEELPQEAEKEFMDICEHGERPFDGYYINRRFMFMGRWLKHAYYPNWNLRLFKHRLGRYEKLTDLDTSSGDVEIHEHIIIDGKVGYLKSEMKHFAFPTVTSFVEKHNRYSNWEARIESGKKISGARGTRLRIKLKRFSKQLPFRPFFRFLYVYIFQRGFLDGPEGYYFARLHGFYEFLCVCKSYELRKKMAEGKAHRA